MFAGSGCFALPRWFLISFFFLCQLTWILPSIFLLFDVRPGPDLSIALQGQNASRHIRSEGAAGPFTLLGKEDLSSLNRAHEKWSFLWPKLRGEFVANGLSPIARRTCFIWLPECYKLAKHTQILHVVKEAIGPDVLLRGLTVWDGENQALQQFHRDAEIAGCQKSLSFVSGTSVQLITHSYNISERMLPAILKILMRNEAESMKNSSKTEQATIFNKLFIARIKRLIRSADARLESFEGADGDGVFVRGGTIFRLGEVMEGRKGLLMQFISADCKVRESQQQSWAVQGTVSSLYMPPVLLVAGAITESSEFNDVRIALVRKEAKNVKSGHASILTDPLRSANKLSNYSKLSKTHEMVVFSGEDERQSWQEIGTWRSQKVGQAATAIMSSGRLDQFRVSGKSPVTRFHDVASSGEQVIVVLREGLLYSRRITNGNYQYSEFLELRPGSAVLLASQFRHALKPLGPDTAFISFHWVAYEDEEPYHERMQPIDQVMIRGFRKGWLDKELLEHGSTRATEGLTISLASGQAYDPDNNENCDVLVFVIEGNLLQVLPSNTIVQSCDIILIPADQSCVLWNVGTGRVRLFAMHLCHFNDAKQFVLSYGASGKIF